MNTGRELRSVFSCVTPCSFLWKSRRSGQDFCLNLLSKTRGKSQHDDPKHLYLSTRLHGVTSQKTISKYSLQWERQLSENEQYGSQSDPLIFMAVHYNQKVWNNNVKTNQFWCFSWQPQVGAVLTKILEVKTHLLLVVAFYFRINLKSRLLASVVSGWSNHLTVFYAYSFRNFFHLPLSFSTL